MHRVLAVIASFMVIFSGAVLLLANLKPASPMELRSEIILDMPVDDAWGILRDLSLAHHYVPGVVYTEITTKATQGVGASRRVYTDETQYINETVTDWQPGRGFDLVLHADDGAAPAPFKRASFSYALKSDGVQATLLTTRLRFTMRGGLPGQWLAKVALAGTFQGRLDAISASLKMFYESRAMTVH